MPFCPHCGNEVEAAIPWTMTEDKTVSAEVEIAKINAERDVEVAKISARTDRDYNETRTEVAQIEADAQVAEATVEAELIGDAITAGIEPEPEPEPVPVVVEPGPEPEPEPDFIPPVPDKEPKVKQSSGWWDGYH